MNNSEMAYPGVLPLNRKCLFQGEYLKFSLLAGLIALGLEGFQHRKSICVKNYPPRRNEVNKISLVVFFIISVKKMLVISRGI